MKNIRCRLIQGILILIFLVLGGIGYFLIDFSKRVAEENLELAYMRVPVLVMALVIIGMAMVGIVLSILVLQKYRLNTLFQRETLVLLQWVGSSFFIGALAQILLIIYTTINVAGSIINIWVFFGMLLYLLVSQIFMLLADVISKGVDLQVDHDLTI